MIRPPAREVTPQLMDREVNTRLSSRRASFLNSVSVIPWIRAPFIGIVLDNPDVCPSHPQDRPKKAFCWIGDLCCGLPRIHRSSYAQPCRVVSLRMHGDRPKPRDCVVAQYTGRASAASEWMWSAWELGSSGLATVLTSSVLSELATAIRLMNRLIGRLLESS